MYFDWLSNQLLQGDYQASLAIYKKKDLKKEAFPREALRMSIQYI